MASQPFGLLEREALLGRLEVERQHLVVPACLSSPHFTHLKYTGCSSPSAASPPQPRGINGAPVFLPDKARVHFGVDFNKSSVALSHSGVSHLYTHFLCGRSCSEGSGRPNLTGGVKPQVGGVWFLHSFLKRMSNIRHSDEKGKSQELHF